MTTRPLLIAGISFAMAMIAIPLDGVFAQAFDREVVPGEIVAMLNRAETFGHGYGVLFIILTVWILTRCEFRKLSPLIVCSLGAGLVADLIKMCVGRTRPFAVPDGFAGSTFTGFMPWWGSGSLHQAFDHANQSFPSAHTATAFGLAICLATMYPHGSRWFFTLATLVGVQRVVAGAHHVSDVFAGAALGLTFATLALRYYAARNQHCTESADAVILQTHHRRELGRAV